MARARTLFLRRLFLTLPLAGCSTSPPPKPPPPPVQPAPPEQRWLAIHVHQLVTPPETPDDQDEYHHMPGYTAMLRDAFSAMLQKAGYTVIVGRKSPRDLVAKVQATWPSNTPGVATLLLLDGSSGRTVQQLSALIPNKPHNGLSVYLEEHAAVELVNALSRSEEVASFAAQLRRRRTPEIAAPPRSGE